MGFLGIISSIGRALFEQPQRRRLNNRPDFPPSKNRGNPQASPDVGWIEKFPRRAAFLDVETTGLSADDRIVSMAYVIADRAKISAGGMAVSANYLLFNPGRKSSPGAYRAHGLKDALLTQKLPFALKASEIKADLDSVDLIVAHNAKFDKGFVDREMDRSGVPGVTAPFYCTMEAYRAQGAGESTSLANIAQRLGIPQSYSHNALADAWFCMQIYLYLIGANEYRNVFPAAFSAIIDEEHE